MIEEGSETKPDLVLYGHPFSAYTWKVLIALYAEGTPFEFRIVDADHPDHAEVVRQAGPLAKFPVLADKGNLIFEATSIVEYLSLHRCSNEMIVPTEEDAAIGMRMLDRVFDNYVMGPVQVVVDEYIRHSKNPDSERISEAKDRLERSYAWLEGWLQYYPPMGRITLIECAAAPSLYLAQRVLPIGSEFPVLSRWRKHLLQLPPVARCIEQSKPYEERFPLKPPSDEA